MIKSRCRANLVRALSGVFFASECRMNGTTMVHSPSFCSCSRLMLTLALVAGSTNAGGCSWMSPTTNTISALILNVTKSTEVVELAFGIAPRARSSRISPECLGCSRSALVAHNFALRVKRRSCGFRKLALSDYARFARRETAHQFVSHASWFIQRCFYILGRDDSELWQLLALVCALRIDDRSAFSIVIRISEAGPCNCTIAFEKSHTAFTQFTFFKHVFISVFQLFIYFAL
jgi:hypothetical protein